MKRLIYTNLHGYGLHYPLIDYLLNIKSFYQKGDFLVVNFWDLQTYYFEAGGFVNHIENKKAVREMSTEISQFLNALGIRHKIIYLSDGIRRLNSREHLFTILLNCYGQIRFADIEDTYVKHKYLKLRPTTLSKINYMVIDYLICIYFDTLYPNVSQGMNPSIYHTGERFSGIRENIERTLQWSDSLVTLPKVCYWKALPLLNYNQENWMNITMNKSDLNDVIEEFYDDDKTMLKDLVSIVCRLNNKRLNHKVNELYTLIDDDGDREMIIEETTDIIYEFFSRIRDLIRKSRTSEIKKITYVETKEHLHKVLSTINPSKLEILKLCNGENTIADIIEKTSMKESSVRSYISRMKVEGLITNAKKPLRLTDEIVINFE